MSSYYDISISQCYEEVEDQYRVSRQIVERHAHQFMLIRRFLHETWSDRAGTHALYVTIGFTPTSLQGVIVQFTLREGEKLAVVEPILTYLLERGFEAQPTENGFLDSITYPFLRRDGTELVRAYVRVWPELGSTCHRIQVGTKPTYQLVCE